MICLVCRKHATFSHTLFRGTSPVSVTLCGECAAKHDAQGRLDRIKSTADKTAKHAAVEEFLKAVGR